MSDWALSYEEYAPDQVGVREALLTLGNGYFATRGAAEEADADDINYPGTYLAGGYNRLETAIAGETIENEDFVNFPNWLVLKFRPKGGNWLNLLAVDLLDYRVQLDMRAGLLVRHLRFKDRDGRITRVVSRRLVHMSNPHLAAIEMAVTAENWSGSVDLRSALDGRVINAGVTRYDALNSTHLEPAGQGGGGSEPIWLRVRTTQSRLEVTQAARTEVFRGEERLSPNRSFLSEPGYVADDLNLDLAEGETITVEKVVALCSSRDAAISEPSLDARSAAARAPRFSALAQSQAAAWANLWRRADIRLENEKVERATLFLHLHTFHLLQTVSPNNVEIDAGAPARGLHGEAYRGHIFWDELFVFPFYNYRFPGIARALLLYRYRRLEVARRNAEDAGFRGAMYPWQSASNGHEESQRLHLNPHSGRWLPDNTSLQRHVNAAVAYNVWQYVQATSDLQFLEHYGAEIILEIARFWSSVAAWDDTRERYVIRGVVGPDEYHDAYPDRPGPGIDNNAYTNIMAVWTLRTALTALDALPQPARTDLRARIGLDDNEIALWHDITAKMFVPFHDGRIISQFDGYDALDEFDWTGYRDKYRNIQRLDRILDAEGDTPNRYKVSKQADVLMLFFLLSTEQLAEILGGLGYDFDPSSIPENIEYYIARTSHGSTLSRVVHAWVLARSDRPRAWKLFLEALETEIGGGHDGTTAEGIHLGAMAATIDLVERCFSGLELRDDRLWLNPCLPKELSGLAFAAFYKGNWFDVHITSKQLCLKADRYSDEAVEVFINDLPHSIAPGQTLEIPLASRISDTEEQVLGQLIFSAGNDPEERTFSKALSKK